MSTSSASLSRFVRATLLAIALLVSAHPAGVAAEDPGCPACGITMKVTRAAPTTTNVSATPFVFTLSAVTINVGDTVTWTNNSSSAINHTTTSDTPGLWDSGSLSQTQSFSHTFTTAGTFGYHCSFHGSPGTGMAGTVTVNAVPVAPVITSVLTASGTVGAPFSYQIAATNVPTSYAASGLPAGLTVDTATGLISGTPTVAAAGASVTISATNGAGTTPATLTLTITAAALGAPVISSASSASGSVGAAFTYSILASNSPTSYAATGLPAGLSVNATSGVISGTPTVAGSSNVTISASNGNGNGSTTLDLTISAAVGGGGGGPVYGNTGTSGHSCGLGAGASALIGLLLVAVYMLSVLRLRRDGRNAAAGPGQAQ
jgi:plastocyanin